MAAKNTKAKDVKQGSDLTGRDRMAWNTFVSWLSHIVLIVSGFIMPRMIDSHIGQVQLGIWDFCWSFVNYLNLLGLGVGSSVNRYVAKYRVENRYELLNIVVSSVALIQAVLAFLVLVGASIIAWLLPLFYSEQLHGHVESTQYVVLLLGFSLAIQMFFDTARGVITGCHRWDLHNSIHALVSVVNLILMIVVLVYGGGIVDIASVYCMVIVLFEIVRVVMARKVLPDVKIRYKKASLSEMRRMFKFGMGTILFRTPPIILIQTINVILVGTLGPAVLAIFSRPIALVRHIKAFISKFSFILTPSAGAMKDDKKQLSAFLIQTTRASIAMTLPLVLFLVVFGDILLTIWMGPDYANWWVISILAIGFFLPVAHDSIISILIGMNIHLRIATILMVLVAMIALAMGIWIHQVGWSLINAALLVSIPLTVSYGLVLPYFACKKLEVEFLSYCKKVILFPLLLNLPMLVCILIARNMVVQESYILSIIAFVVGYTLLLIFYVFFIFPENVKRKIIKNSICKKLFLAGIFYGGIMALFRFASRKHVTVLMIHGVMSDKHQNNWEPMRSHLAPDSLEYSLKVLTKYYNFINLDDAVEILRGKKKPINNAIVVTFDDGYSNFLSHAMPILSRFNITPAVFIATKYIDTQIPYWFDRIDYLIQLPECDGSWIEIFRKKMEIKNSNRDELNKTFDKFRVTVKNYKENGLEIINSLDTAAALLENDAGINPYTDYKENDWIRPMSWEEVQAAINIYNVEFGSHTINHPNLNMLSKEEIWDEVTRSKQKIEAKLGMKCKFFCYPYGFYDAKVVDCIKNAAYIAALSSDVGVNKIGDSLYTLKRLNFPSQNSKREILYSVSSIRLMICSLKNLVKARVK